VAGADWQASHLQLSLFTQRALSLNADIFSAFAGAPPDVQEDRPKEATRRQGGRMNDAQLSVQITPVRVDIVSAPAPSAAIGEDQFSIGELKSQLTKFAKASLDWLPTWDVPTTRLSLLVRAVAFAETPAACLQILQDNIRSVRIRPDEMSDLIFRVNWKAKTATLAEGFYNRITTWTVHQLVMSGMTGPGQDIPLLTKNFAQVEMDLNTPHTRATALPPDRLTTIYKDLHQLALEIADNGEGT
jgi:hypothetical protein